MYFLWKRTSHGMIRVSCEGLKNFVGSFLSSQFRLHSLAVSERSEHHVESEPENGDRWLTMILSSRDPSSEPRVERRLSHLVRPLGLISSVAWISRGSPGAEWIETCRAILGSPWVWMSLASSVALAAIAGWAAFFWTAFCGPAAWFIVRGLSLLIRSSFFKAAGRR